MQCVGQARKGKDCGNDECQGMANVSFIHFLQGKDVNGRFLMDFVAFYDKVKQAQIYFFCSIIVQAVKIFCNQLISCIFAADIINPNVAFVT